FRASALAPDVLARGRASAWLSGSCDAASNRRAKMIDHNPTLSIVVPMHNEQGNVSPLLARLASAVEALPGRPAYEIVLVNDGSSDATADAIRAEMRARPN